MFECKEKAAQKSFGFLFALGFSIFLPIYGAVTGKHRVENQANSPQINKDLPWKMSTDGPYFEWRQRRLTNLNKSENVGFVAVNDLAKPTDSERAELVRRCRETNTALYHSDSGVQDQDRLCHDLRAFAGAMGLMIAEGHRSADPDGIVALTGSDKPAQRGFIPYSRKAMNWHTDGYYNAPEHQIRAMILHCAVPADNGGENQFLDPELAYIRLRDHNPDFVQALMHPQAMTIPENAEADGSVRPVSIGPVFSVDQDGQLAMRYTARTRSITWRDDETTRQAAATLQSLLEQGDPLMQSLRFEAGQGVLCNNVLHNRTGFDADTEKASDRLVFRVRFHNRVKGS